MLRHCIFLPLQIKQQFNTVLMDFKPTSYRLLSPLSGKIYDDTGWMLDEPDEKRPHLLRAVYTSKQINVKPAEYGIYRFADWLPVKRILQGSAAPVTFKSTGLATRLGLNNLYITFSGYWPDKGAFMTTCSFKETEAYSVCGRMDENHDKTLVVASAGNTARAFAKVCSDNHIPLLLCVPHDNLDALWFDKPLNSCVKLIVSPPGSDYFDAIHLSNLACECDGFIAEGGAKNVARRDGMATTMLSAATHIGSIPEYYFQAIGSGTGAIAAWEANLRLLEDGRFGSNLCRLMVSQNHPFVPIKNAWESDSRAMLPFDDEQARKEVEAIDAKVLSNRKPPYPPAGGLYDALKHAGGNVLEATNSEARDAAALFESVEGCDIHPASAVAVASLIKQAEAGTIPTNSIVMLNITGGGENKFKAGKELFYLKPAYTFDLNPQPEHVMSVLKDIF
jgi:cysteate synthase